VRSCEVSRENYCERERAMEGVRVCASVCDGESESESAKVSVSVSVSARLKKSDVGGDVDLNDKYILCLPFSFRLLLAFECVGMKMVHE